MSAVIEKVGKKKEIHCLCSTALFIFTKTNRLRRETAIRIGQKWYYAVRLDNTQTSSEICRVTNVLS